MRRMNAIDKAREDRSRNLARLRKLTIGTAALGVAATSGFGYLAAVATAGTSTAASTTAVVTTTTATTPASTTTTSTTATSTTSAPTVTTSSGAAHVSSGGS